MTDSFTPGDNPQRTVSEDGRWEWDGTAWVPRNTPGPYAHPGYQGHPGPPNQPGYPPYAQQPYAQQPYAQQPYAQQPYAQQPYAQQPYGYPGIPTPPHQYATYGARAGAYLIDATPFIAAYLLQLLITFAFLPTTDTTGTGLAAIALTTLAWLAAFAFAMYNQVWLQGTTGQSYGKRLTRIRLVTDTTAAPVGWTTALGRYFAHILDSMACYLGWLLPLFTPKKQTIADMVCATVVVTDNPN